MRTECICRSWPNSKSGPYNTPVLAWAMGLKRRKSEPMRSSAPAPFERRDGIFFQKDPSHTSAPPVSSASARAPAVARHRSAGAGHDASSLPFERLPISPTLIHASLRCSDLCVLFDRLRSRIRLIGVVGPIGSNFADTTTRIVRFFCVWCAGGGFDG
jgi:hypothetical protein